jgi:CHAT domain-containing protein/tetratricopeptide (TPR) repeat protein
MVRAARVPAALLVLGLCLLAPRLVGAEDAPSTEAAAKLERAAELEAQVVSSYRSGKYLEGVPLAEASLKLREEVLGPEHADVAASLHNLALLRKALGQPALARPLFERSIQIKERVLGPEHPDLAASLSSLAWLAEDQGEHEKAEGLHRRGLAIHEKALGPAHPNVATSLNNYGVFLETRGKYEQAREVHVRALEIRERALGPEHADTATSVHNLAGVLRVQGRFDEALPLMERALAIRERVLGPDHPEVAGSLNNLSQLLFVLGRYEAARPLLERALRVKERALGPQHPDLAVVLGNLAELLRAMGQADAARPSYERAIAIREGALGPEHPSLATSLNNFAGFLASQGQDEAARPLHERALRIREKALGPEHPAVATSLVNLAGLLKAQGAPEAAQPLLERALTIQEKALGPEHPDLAGTLSNLAGVLGAQGRHDAARPHYQRALTLVERALGPDHPLVATLLNNLAQVLWALHEDAAARPLYERALSILEHAHGPEHALVAPSLSNLAQFLVSQGECEAARPLHERAIGIVERDLRRGLAGLVGVERLRRADGSRALLDRWLLSAPRCGRTGYDEVLRIRGLVTRSEAAERALLRSGGDAARTRRDEVLALDRRLGGLSASVPRDPAKRAAWRRLCGELAARREALLLALAADYAPLREAKARHELAPTDVSSALVPGEVLVEYLRVRDAYVAFVVRPGAEALRIDLGPNIDEAAAAFTADVARGDAAGASAERLSALVLAPLRTRLPAGTRRVYVCPDAALAAVPFAALPGAKPGTALIDELEIVFVEMAQDVVAAASPQASGEGALILGGVDYGAASGPAIGTAPSTLVGRPPRDVRRWEPLPGTATEAERLRQRLAGEMLTGAAATEERFRTRAPGRALLHVATHGYVHADRLASALRRRDERAAFDATLERQVAVGIDPMLLAGVALAGADVGDGGSGDDGLLTAAEVSWLDLEGVRLAVLSACETGRGTPAAGEGTLGLVRGFRLAGARSVVASLWKVDDAATTLLMERFYDAFLDRKLAPCAALREAARTVRAFTDAGGNKPFAAPRYWAAFVAYGR